MLQQTEVQKSVYTAFRDSPFALQESVKEVYVKAGSSIQEIIDEAIQEEWQRKYLRVVLNDEVIQPENYALTFVNEKDVVGMVLVPQSGEVGQIFKAVAIIAIVVAVTWALGPQGYALVGPSMAAGLGAAAGLAATLALNALFPPPVPGLPSTGSSGTSEDPVYGFSRTGNQLGKYAAIPRIYGTRKVFPQHAIAPYIIAEGSDQYLYQAFTAGYGPLKIEDIRIGENAIGNYKEVEYYVHEAFEAGDELKIVKEDNWQDPYSIKLLKNEEQIVATTDDADKASLAIQFPQGLFNQWADDGSRHQWTVILDVKVRQAGTSTWFPVTNYTPTITDGVINSSTTSDEWTEVSTQYSSDTPNYPVVTELPPSSTLADGERRTLATTVASGDTYFGDNVQTNYITVYQDFENNYVVSTSTSEIKVEKTTSRPFFTNINVVFPTAGKWEFRVVRLSDDYDGSPTGNIRINPYSETYISSVRSIKNTPPIASDKPISLIELKIKATDQLNGAVNNLSCVVKSKLPIWNGSSWSVQETRNPAWAYLDVMRGNATKTPVNDSRLDLAAFKTWADWCDETQPNFAFTPPTTPNTATNVGFVTNLYYTILYRVPDTDGLNFWVGKLDSAELTRNQVQSFFYQSAEAATINRACCDLEVTSQTTAWEVLKLIAATGYATPSQNGGKYSITVDRERDTPVQIFTPKNIKSFSGNMSYYVKPHALRIEYTKTNETDVDEIIVYDDDYNADGSGGKQQATIFETMKLVGISRYNQAYTVGRRAIAQGQLRIETFTIDCDVENLLATRGSLVRLQHDVPKIGAGSGRIVAVSGGNITIDEPFKLTTGSIYAHVRHIDGTQSVRSLFSVSGSNAIISGATVSEGDLIIYGELNRVDLECLVKSVRPGNDLTATLELVPYAPAIYSADTDAIPDRDPWGSNWTGGNGGGTTGANKTTPGPVTSLQGSYQITYANKTPSITVTLSWSKPYAGGPAYSYKIYYQDTNGWRLLGETTELTYIAFNEYVFTDANGDPIDLNGKALKFAVSAVGSDLSSFPPDSAAQVTVTPTIANPNAVMTLTAVGGFFENILTWSYQTTGFDVAFVEIWGVMAYNDRDQASLIAKVAVPATTYSHTGLDVAQTWYYWIRLVDANGNFSDWYPESATAGVACSPSDDPQYLLSILFGAINTDQIAAGLNERIDLIDIGGNPAYPEIPNGLIAKVNIHDGDINTLYTDTDTIANNLLDAAVLIDKHETMITGAGIYVDETTGEVHIYGVDNLQGQLNLVEADLDAANAQIALRATQAYVDEAIVNAVIDPSQIAELDDLYARVSTVEVDLDAAETAISLKANLTTVNGIDARLSTAEIDIDALEGEIVTKVSNTEFDDLGARVTTAEETLSTINGAEITRAVEDIRWLNEEQDMSAEAMLRNLLTEERNFKTNQNAIAFATETLRAYTDEKTLAEATARLALGAALNATDAQLAASLTEEQTARVTADAAEVLAREELAAQIESDLATVNGSIVNEAAIRLAADEAEAAAREALAVSIDNDVATLEAAITSEATARADADSAEASARNTLAARLDSDIADVEAYIISEQNARVSADEALTTSLNSLTATVADNTAAILTEATTRANADSALSSTITTVSAAANKQRTYRQPNQPTTEVFTGDIWFDTDDNNKAYRFNGTTWELTDDLRIAAAQAAIQTEAIARANGDSANASLITTVQSSLNSQIASVQQYAETTADALGDVEAKWGVRVQSNGRVSGVELNSGGQSYSSFTVLADVFNVYHPTDGVPRQVFGIGTVNGVTRVGISGSLIVDGSIVADKVRSGTLSGVAIEITNVMNTDAAAGYLRLTNLISNSVGGRNNTSWTNSSPAVQFSANTRLVIDGKGEFGNNIYVKGTMLPFTGSHRAVSPLEVNYQPGEIIVDGQLYDEGDMSNTIYFAEKSSVANQRGVIGVFLEDEFRQFEDVDGTITVTNWLDDGNKYVLVNAVGEGKVLVCGENGNISRGDLIVTSSMPGRGMKQDDDIIRGYTVAKAREDVVFSSPSEVKLVSCIYLCG